MHHTTLPALRQPSWDDLRILLACSTAASFRRASVQLGVSSSTVVRRIERLERSLHVQLFERLPDGIALTDAGRTIAQSARGMETALFSVIQGRDHVISRRTAVSISATEGLGSYWIMPQLVGFQRQHPELLIHLRCAMGGVDVLRLEADLSIQFDAPSNPDLIVVKLGRLNVFTYASADYLRTYGTPRSARDMRHHRLLNQVAPQLDDDAWGRFLGTDDVNGLVAIATNNSTALLFAVEAGGGIGALPTYVGALNASLVPVDIGIRHQIDIWLTYRKDLRKNERKVQVIEWLKSIFDPKAHPYFADEFIAPPDPRLRPNVESPMPSPHPLARW